MEEKTTKEKLLTAAIELFSEYGYEGTTTRMITDSVNAKNLAAIRFHFGGKDELYQAVFIRIAELLTEVQWPLFDEIDLAKKNGLITQAAAWDYIVELISQQIEWTTNHKYMREIKLVHRELLHPIVPSISFPILTPIFRYLEKLFIIYTASSDVLWARNYSYYTLCALYAYNNYPKFINTYFERDIYNDETGFGKTKTELKQDTLCGIRSVLNNRIFIERNNQ